jgi:energy-coupling factor transporter ATP-binding protein EcfA2
MIDYIQFKGGYPLEIPSIGTKRFTFNKGINILFGPNGCGKSTILKTMKAYCGIQGGGWTYINDPMRLASNNFPFAYLGLTPSRCEADIGWDGTPSFFNDGDIKVSDTFFYMNEKSSDDGITSEAEQLDMLAEKPSSGQYRIKKVNRVFNLIRDVPGISENDIPNGYNHTGCSNEIKYWKSLGQKGPQTILLDEPERALSISLQKKLFTEILPKFTDLQVIIATHSIFCLNMKDVNYIEFEPNYINECRDAFKI